MPANTLISSLCESLLATSETVLATIPYVPDRSLVTWSEDAVPVGDCDELAVWWARGWRSNSLFGRGLQTPPQPRAQPSLPVATIRVRLSVACWPTLTEGGNDFPVQTVTDAATAAYDKYGTLLFGIAQEANAGTLFADVTELGDGCERVEVTEWRPIPPAGRVISAGFDVSVTAVHFAP